MKQKLFLFIIILALAAIIFYQETWQQACPEQSPVLPESTSIFFCPEQKCSEQLISKIDSAEKTVHVAIYSFTHDEIADALIDAKMRGVEVKVLMESQQAGSEYSDDEKLKEAGIEVRFMDNPLGIMHNKFSVFDSESVATGSFNYTANADERNNENLLIIESGEIALEYENEFQKLWGAG